MLLLKISGLILIMLTCTLFGINKSNFLKRRAEKLNGICMSLSRLSSLIKSETGELDTLLEACFAKDIFVLNGEIRLIDESFLKKDDTVLLNKFLKDAGMQDSESEYKRTLNFISLFEKRASDAQKACSDLSKLYNTLGFLIGVSICIFFI